MIAASSCAYSLPEQSTIANALAFGEAGFPIIPVTLQHEGDRWRKQPMASWSLATADEATIAGWWQRWPDALPGIPLARMGWAVVDADRRDGVDGVAAVTGLGPLGPHSKVATPSGGLHLVFAQPDPPITKLRWCDGVEVLGSSCLLTAYDLEELLFPRVAPRAVLPRMFWRPKANLSSQEHLKIKRSAPHTDDAVEVANLTAALWQLDPCEWRGEYDAWFQLATACRFLGIARAEFVGWSVSDPHYAADVRLIERIWDSARPVHGGAFFAALKAAGIKVTEGTHKAAEPCLYLEVPLTARATASAVARDWRSRLDGILRTLRPTERSLFCVACMVAELMAEIGKPKPGIAMQLLEGASAGLRKTLGAEEVRRTITNGFRHVEEKLLSETETATSERN
jgi:Bifunctional DNA primase/polymerase, N-terminal